MHGRTEGAAELFGEQLDGEEEFVGSGLPAVTGWRRDQGATSNDEMQVWMGLHDLPPGVQDHGEADLAAEVLLPEFFEQLRGGLDQQVVEQFLVEPNEGIEEVIDGEDDVIIMDGQKPELLGFEPLGLFEGATFGTVTVLAGFVVELPVFAGVADLHYAAQGRGAAVQDGANRLALLIRQAVCASEFPDVFAEDIRHFIAGTL